MRALPKAAAAFSRVSATRPRAAPPAPAPPGKLTFPRLRVALATRSALTRRRHARAAVLSDPVLRDEYDKATEFDVESMALEEYLRRFTALILTVNGLGSVGGWGDEVEAVDPLFLAFQTGAPAQRGACCAPRSAAAESRRAAGAANFS